ncbi:MAG: 50S ribosomal protein L15 [Planctomycetota bacterium]|jgi:large subunit ribosomal protein L15|nr:50S ribosomal protein L15 [Planctomycetota bacterium]
MNITDVNNRVKAAKKRHRVGRGAASGSGKTAGRGMKGAGARAGEAALRGFIGGQSPLRQRIPKRGFNNAEFKTEYLPVNLEWLNENFSDGATVGIDELKAAGKDVRRGELVKILGAGEITKKITVKAHAFSQAAIEKIVKVGGKTEIIALVKEVREVAGKRAKKSEKSEK